MIEDYYTSGFEVKRLSYTNDGGVPSNTYTTALTIDGRMRPLSGREILQNEKLNYITTHRFYCGIHEIQSDDKIYDSNTGKVYNVELIRNPMEMDDHLEIDCKWIEDHQLIETIIMSSDNIVSS